MSGTIVKVSGPLVVAEGLENANMADVVRVGEQRLIGEILNMTGGRPFSPAFITVGACTRARPLLCLGRSFSVMSLFDVFIQPMRSSTFSPRPT